MQDFGSNKNARIRGVEVNWDLLKPAEAEKTNVGNIFAIGDVLDNKPELTPVAIQVLIIDID